MQLSSNSWSWSTSSVVMYWDEKMKEIRFITNKNGILSYTIPCISDFSLKLKSLLSLTTSVYILIGSLYQLFYHVIILTVFQWFSWFWQMTISPFISARWLAHLAAVCYFINFIQISNTNSSAFQTAKQTVE